MKTSSEKNSIVRGLAAGPKLFCIICLATLPLALIALGAVLTPGNIAREGWPGLALAFALPALAWIIGVSLIWLVLTKVILRQLTDTMKTQEENLFSGLEEQKRLTREIHHRVKNNLQVVASLLSLHARAAKSPDAATAYASIQRRVDALAVVQRNLLENGGEHEGMGIRPVVAELSAGLHQSAPGQMKLTIALDIADIRVAQDIAVPVAFLITELVELAMLCSEEFEIAVRLTHKTEELAELMLQSQALAVCPERIEFERYSRVMNGLARQLRTEIQTSDDNTEFYLQIPVLPPQP